MRIDLRALLALASSLLFLLLMSALLRPAPAAAADTPVSCSAAALIEAITTANANPGPDVLRLAKGCSYSLSAVDNSTDGPNGLPSITGELFIKGNGATIQRVLGDPDDFRLFHVAAAGALTLDGLTVQYGQLSATTNYSGSGAAILSRGQLELRRVTITSNNSLNHDGGALAIVAGRAWLEQTTLADNSARNLGGGLVAYPGATELRLRQVTLVHNSADMDSGGGLYSAAANTSINNALVQGNAASKSGGGLRLLGPATIANATFSGNTAGSEGGAIAADNLSYLRNSSFSGNEANRGGALWTASPLLRLWNSVLWANTANQGPQLYKGAGATTRISHSLIQGSGGSGPGWNAGLGIDDGGNLDTDPFFTRLPDPGEDGWHVGIDDYGDLRPVRNSLTVDAGDQNLLPANAYPDVTNRSRLVGPEVDMGAYEASGPRLLVNQASREGLAGYWAFDEGLGGQSQDRSGNANPAILQAGAAFSDLTGAGLTFANPYATAISGPSAHLSVADAASLNLTDTLTLAAWVWLEAPGNDQEVIGKVPASQERGYLLGVNAGQLEAEFWSGSGGATSLAAGSVPTKTWTHLAVTWQAGGDLIAYIDGQEVGRTAAPEAIGVSSQALVIGAAPWDPTLRRASGLIDEVRLYERALTPPAVAALAAGLPCAAGGQDWANAQAELFCAFDAATPGVEIWVAQGSYRPSWLVDRVATFRLQSGVAVYGGFSGLESELDARDWASNPTILSGDLKGDSLAPFSNASDNSYHVVTGHGTDATAVLDGFTIRDGNANGLFPQHDIGGGIVIGIGSDGSGSPTLRNLVLRYNSALYGGGGLALQDGGSPLIANALFVANKAGNRGGAIYQEKGVDASYINLTVTANEAPKEGGLYINASDSSPVLTNSIVAANLPLNGAQIGASSAANFTIGHSLIAGSGGSGPDWKSYLGLDGGGNLDGDPLFLVPPDPGDGDWSTPADNVEGDLRLGPGSPAINAGLVDYLPAGLTRDLAGQARIAEGQVDQGAYEAQPEITEYLIFLPQLIRP